MIHIDVSGAGTAGCEPVLNAEHQLLITANGGGTTYETLKQLANKSIVSYNYTKY